MKLAAIDDMDDSFKMVEKTCLVENVVGNYSEIVDILGLSCPCSS